MKETDLFEVNEKGISYQGRDLDAARLERFFDCDSDDFYTYIKSRLGVASLDHNNQMDCISLSAIAGYSNPLGSLKKFKEHMLEDVFENIKRSGEDFYQAGNISGLSSANLVLDTAMAQVRTGLPNYLKFLGNIDQELSHFEENNLLIPNSLKDKNVRSNILRSAMENDISNSCLLAWEIRFVQKYHIYALEVAHTIDKDCGLGDTDLLLKHPNFFDEFVNSGKIITEFIEKRAKEAFELN